MLLLYICAALSRHAHVNTNTIGLEIDQCLTLQSLNGAYTNHLLKSVLWELHIKVYDKGKSSASLSDGNVRTS